MKPSPLKVVTVAYKILVSMGSFNMVASGLEKNKTREQMSDINRETVNLISKGFCKAIQIPPVASNERLLSSNGSNLS